MIRLAATSTLFILFVCSQVAVKNMEGFTRHYEACMDVWKDRIHTARQSPVMTERLLNELDQKGVVSVNGISCPALWPEHQDRARALLTIR